jgi:hypothetical protein
VARQQSGARLSIDDLDHGAATIESDHANADYGRVGHVLDRYGLSLELEQDPDPERPAPSSEAIDLFDVMLACLEEALAT